MTDLSQNELAQSVLSPLLVGATVQGLRFGILQLIFEPELTVPGEPYINLASAWSLYPARPDAFPENETDVADVSADEEILAAVSLRHKVVSTVEILEPWPHLVLTFSDNSVLYLNGKNDQYEPWTAGLAHAPPGEEVQVIACPGGELAFIFPSMGANNSFKPKPLRGSA
jgi:hypothetical protein